MKQTNPQNIPQEEQEEMDKFKPETGNPAINELNEQEIDKAKTELKILKEYINKSYKENRKTEQENDI